MKTQVGKCYRMNCGGAIVIEKDTKQWSISGRHYDSDMFDLIAEITEAEYKVIINGGSDIRTYQAMQEEIEALKAKSKAYADAYVKLSMDFESLKAEDSVRTSAMLDTAETSLGKMHDEIKALKAENKALEGNYKSVLEHDRLMCNEANRANEKVARLKKEAEYRRLGNYLFPNADLVETAKMAMQGLLSDRYNDDDEEQAKIIAEKAVKYAKELRKALEMSND